MSRPPQRFVIRRISIRAKTNLPWTLTDTHRPNYIGRHPTMTAALAEVDASPKEATVPEATAAPECGALHPRDSWVTCTQPFGHLDEHVSIDHPFSGQWRSRA